jgi:membrane protease YdiL (CAAX protease family)
MAFAPFSKLTLGILLLMTMLFVYLAADFIYGPYAPAVKNVMIVYFILFVMVMAGLKSGMPLLDTSPVALSSFAVGFAVTAVVFLFIPLKGFAGEITMTAVKMALGFGILHGFIKAYIEEAVFRGILMKRIGIFFSNIFFGVFHIGVIILGLTAMGLAVTFASVGIPVAILIALGFAWSFIAQRWGLMASTGSHLAYNLAAFGVLKSVLGVAG